MAIYYIVWSGILLVSYSIFSNSGHNFAASPWLLVTFVSIYKLIERLIRIPQISLQDKNNVARAVLITGCDSGFGRILAERLAKRGILVFAGCFLKSSLMELNEMKNIEAILLDVRSDDSVNAAVSQVNERLGKHRGLWAIFNNAGVSGSKLGFSFWLKSQDFMEVLDVNLLGIARVSEAFADLLMLGGAGSRIINTSSVLGRFAMSDCAPYCASKFAVQALSDCQRREGRKLGIRVVCIEPGYFSTNITNVDSLVNAFKRGYESISSQRQKWVSSNYLKEITSTIDFLSPIYVKNVNLVVDAYETAMLARWPCARYMVGWNATWLFWPMSIMPEWLSDWIFNLMTG